MEVQTERRPILIVMPIEVVVQKAIKLIASKDVGTGVDHSAPGQIFVEVRVFPTIEFVHDDFPNGVASGRTVLQISVTPVGHSKVHGIRPERRVAQRSSDGGIVQESLFLHHGELVVASDSQIRSSDTYDAVVGDVGVLLDDDPHTGHLLGPVVYSGVAPELLVVVMPVRS